MLLRALLLCVLFPSILSAQDRLVAEMSGYYVNVVGLAYSLDGKKVVSGDHYGVVKVWDAQTHRLLRSWKAHPVEIAAVIFTNDGKRAISASEGTTKMWDISTGELLSELTHEDWIRFMFLSPDNRTLAIAYYDQHMAVWDLERGKIIGNVTHEKFERVDTSVGSPKTRYDQGRSRHLRKLTVPDGIRNIPLDIPGKSPIEPGVKIDLSIFAAFTPDGRYLLVGKWDYSVQIFDLKTGKHAATWKGHKRPITAIAVSSDGKRVLSGDRDGTVLLRELKSGKELARFQNHPGDTYALAFSPDGKDVLSVTENFYFKRWDIATGRVLASHEAYQRNMETVVFSPDRRRALSVNEEDTIKVWDTSTWTEFEKKTPWAGDKKAQLGKTLFFDPRLSGDDSFGCVMCHRPKQAFSDGMPLSTGFSETLYFRNTPTLMNAADQKQLYWDGRFPGDDMPSLVRDHMAEAHFMNVDGRLVEEKLRQAPGYVKMFQEVYGREPTYGNTLDALSAFVASLKSGESPYDRFAGGEKNALSEDAARGYELFNGKAGCAACHAGPQFSDGKLHRRKTPENPEIFRSPLRHISFRRFFRMLGVKDYPTMREDIGYEAISKKRADNRTFRTPSLREAARTGPYMHNGTVKTLDEAVRLENPSLTDSERKDIVAFLKSLSGPLLDIEEPALPPYGVEPYEEMKWPPRTTPVEERKTAAFPPLAPLGPVPVPDDNPQTSEKVALGAFLFFDERTSGNGHTGCAGCHIPLAGWGDMEKLSRNYTSTMHFRNTQTVLNAAYFTKLNWDGARLSLEDQAHDAILSAISHNADPVMVEERLAQEPEYVKRFKEVFGVERPTLDAMLKAISAFMREKAISKNVPFDQYANGDKAALSPEEKRGMELFNGKAGCIRCHNGPLASDENFYDTGVPIPPHFFKVPLLQITLRYIHKGRGVPEEVYRRARTDPGLYLETKNADDVGKFRTASLRELTYTAPYMHNGVFDTLENVVDFYDDGGGASRNKTPLLKPLGLSSYEKADLVAFLKSLSSREVVNVVRPPSDDMAYGASPYVDYFADDGEDGEEGDDEHAR